MEMMASLWKGLKMFEGSFWAATIVHGILRGRRAPVCLCWGSPWLLSPKP